MARRVSKLLFIGFLFGVALKTGLPDLNQSDALHAWYRYREAGIALLASL